MNDMDDKLIQMAREYGLAITSERGEELRFTVAQLAALRSAILADAAKDVEPVAFMFQHSETGRITFVDAWQKENGWSAGNPRFFEVGALVPASTLAAAQAINAELVALLQEAGRTIDNLTACAGRSGQSIQVRAAIFTKSGT